MTNAGFLAIVEGMGDERRAGFLDEERGPFFHGTRYELHPGDLLTGEEAAAHRNYEHVGRLPKWQSVTGKPLYMSVNPGQARWFADGAHEPPGADRYGESGRARVYEVEPTGPHMHDPENLGGTRRGQLRHGGSRITDHPLRVVRLHEEWSGDHGDYQEGRHYLGSPHGWGPDWDFTREDYERMEAHQRQLRKASAGDDLLGHFEAAADVPESEDVFATPTGESPVAGHFLARMRDGQRDPGNRRLEEHPHLTAPDHGPYYVTRDPEREKGRDYSERERNATYHVVDREGRSTHPNEGAYDGSRGMFSGNSSAMQDWYRLTTRREPDEVRRTHPGEVDAVGLHEAYREHLRRNPPQFPHSRVSAYDLELAARPEPRVHEPQGYSPSEEWHGPYEVVRHPQTNRFHVVDNAGRHAMTGNARGFETQHQAEASRDYIDHKRQSQEAGKAFGDALFRKVQDIEDPGGTEESRQSDRALRNGQELMTRYEGGRGKIRFRDDGEPYYELEHRLPSGRPSGWTGRSFGGMYLQLHHQATGEYAHDVTGLDTDPKTGELAAHVGPRHVEEALNAWHGEAGGTREHLEQEDPRIRRWKQRHQAAAEPPAAPVAEVVAHFEAAATPEDYGVSHRPNDEAAPLHDLTQGDTFPADVYDHPEWYDFGEGQFGHDHLRMIRRARGKPGAKVRIWRAAPALNPESRNAKRGQFNPGDWVALNRKYAEQTAAEVNDPPSGSLPADHPGRYHIWGTTVRAQDVRNGNGDDLQEWGYWGEPREALHMHEYCSHKMRVPPREAARDEPPAIVAPHEEPPLSPKRASRQRDGDERPFGYYTLRYRTEDMGERKPRHFIEAHTPEGRVVGRLNWFGATGWVHHMDVAGDEDDTARGSLLGDGRDHQARGLATAMWDWSQEMSPKARHSKDQTEQGKKWARGLKGRERRDPPEGPPSAPARREAVAARPSTGRTRPVTAAAAAYPLRSSLASEGERHDLHDPAPGRAPYPNPHTRGLEWFHGSPHRFGDFGGDRPYSDLEYEDDPDDTSHWNTLLGHHFTACHKVAEQFAHGDHPSGGFPQGGPQENVIHARLLMRSPKHYASEHDMDQEAYEREWKAGNHIERHLDPELKEYHDEGSDVGVAYDYADDGERMRRQDEPSEHYMRQHRQVHPYATGWLNAHPEKYEIAQRHIAHLRSQGHDGIVYGNAFEKSPCDGLSSEKDANRCAIAFGEDQVDVTQRHTGAECLPEDEAQRQWPGGQRHMDPLFDEEGRHHEAVLEATAMDEDDWDDDIQGGHEDDDDEGRDTEDEDDAYERSQAAAEAARRAALPYVEPPREGELRDHMHHMHGMDSRTSDLHMSPKNQERWHAGEHQRTNSTHQHETQRGLPGERQWPDVFQLSEHTDFFGGTPRRNGEFERVLHDPEASRPFRPLTPSESSLHLPPVVAHFGEDEENGEPEWTPPSPAGWSYNHGTYGVIHARGPEGAQDRYYTSDSGLEDHRHPLDAPRPLYHGTRHEIAPGGHVEPGHPGNFTDEPLEHVYMTEHPEDDWGPGGHGKGARGYGRHVYEVRPVGWIGHRSDAQGHDWATQDPAEVIREVPDLRGHTAALEAAAANDEAAGGEGKTYWDDLRPRIEAEHARTGEHERAVARMEAVSGPDDARYAWSGEGGYSCPSCKNWWEHEAREDVSDMEGASWGRMRRYGDPVRGEECQYCNDRLTWPRPHTQAECTDSAECPSSMADILHGKVTSRSGPTEVTEDAWRHKELDPGTPPHVEGDQPFTPDSTRHHYRWGTSDDWHAALAEHHELAGRERAGRDAGRDIDRMFAGPGHDEAMRYLEGNDDGRTAALEAAASGEDDDGEPWDDMDDEDHQSYRRMPPEQDEHGFAWAMRRGEDDGITERDPDEVPQCLHCSRREGAEVRHWPEDGHSPEVEAALARDRARDERWDRGEYDQGRYCNLTCEQSHAEDRAHGIGVHHTFAEGEPEHDEHGIFPGGDMPQLNGPFGEPAGRSSGRYEVRDPSAELRCHYCRRPLTELGGTPQHRQAVLEAGRDDDGLTWEEIGRRHPHLYGDPEVHGAPEGFGPDTGNGYGWDIGDAAAELYHDRPGHPYAESTGELHPLTGYPGSEIRFRPRTVDTSRIDYMKAEPWDPRVKRAADGFRDHRQRDKVPPVVLVHRHGVFQVADGHHRANGANAAHWPSIRAYVAYSPHEDEPFADGRRGPFHGAEAQDRPAPLNYPSGERKRTSYPGFPHAADADEPRQHTAARELEAHFGEGHEVTAATKGGPHTRIAPERDLDGFLWARHRDEASGAEERVPGEAPFCVNCSDSHKAPVHHFPGEGHQPVRRSPEFERELALMTQERCPQCGSRERQPGSRGSTATCANCSHAFDVSPEAAAGRQARLDENVERHRQGLPARGPYYHGTTEEGLQEVTPGRGRAFGMDHEGTHGYATAGLAHAWGYAEKASLTLGRPPRVYQVTPKADDLEKDPFYLKDGWPRGNNDDDVRSRAGFDVKREMPVPEEYRHLHEPDEDDGGSRHEAALEPPGPPSFTWRYQTHGPEGGYVSKEQQVTGPFYHGSRSKRLREGSQVTVGHPTNAWGDEGPRSQFNHFTTDLTGARDYARDAGGHVYEVAPTGEVKGGYNGDEWKSAHPLRVIRRVGDNEESASQGMVISPVADVVPAAITAGTAADEARELLAAIPGFLRFTGERLLAVAVRLEDAPVAREVAEAVHDLALRVIAAAGDGPEGSWEPGPKA